MTVEISKDFFVEVSEDSIANDVTLRVRLYFLEVRKAIEIMKSSTYNSDEYNKAYHVGDKFYSGWEGEGVMTGLMDYCNYNEAYEHLEDECYKLWSEYRDVADAKYREAYEDKFLAFERKNVDYAKGLWIGSEEDYQFYSDWSKDMYGYRKRWTVASRLSE
jgi:hypothetical protein